MTRDDAFIGLLEGYLDGYEGTTPLPESVRDALREQIVTTKQMRPLPGPMRYLSMITLPAPARYGAVAALAIAAVFIGAYALGPRATSAACLSQNLPQPRGPSKTRRDRSSPAGMSQRSIRSRSATPFQPAGIGTHPDQSSWARSPTRSVA